MGSRGTSGGNGGGGRRERSASHAEVGNRGLARMRSCVYDATTEELVAEEVVAQNFHSIMNKVYSKRRLSKGVDELVDE